MTTLMELYPDSPNMRRAARMYRNRCNRLVGIPCSGPFYWLPTPNGRWELFPAFEGERFPGSIGRMDFWREAVDKLALDRQRDPQKWWRRLGNAPRGLPRGRVLMTCPSQWAIIHGGDAPVSDAIDRIRREFHLPPNDNTKQSLKLHEAMIPEHREWVQVLLDLGVQKKRIFHDRPSILEIPE